MTNTTPTIDVLRTASADGAPRYTVDIPVIVAPAVSSELLTGALALCDLALDGATEAGERMMSLASLIARALRCYCRERRVFRVHDLRWSEVNLIVDALDRAAAKRLLEGDALVAAWRLRDALSAVRSIAPARAD